MNINYKFLLFYFFTSLFVSAQDQNSISNIKDSINANIYNNPNKAISFLHQYIRLNSKNNNLDDIILVNSTLALAYELKHEIDSSIYYLNKNLRIAQKPTDVIHTKYNMASLFEGENRSNDALKLYYEILEMAIQNNEEEISESVKTSIISLKSKIRESKDAVKLLEDDYDQKKKINDLNLMFTRKALIEAYININELRKALVLIEQGKSEAITNNDCEYVYYMNFFSSKIHILQNKFKIAEKDARSALKCAIQLENQAFINEIGLINAEIQYLKKDYLSALSFLKSIHVNDIPKSTVQLTKYYKLTADTFQKLDSNRQSTVYYQSYIEEKENFSKRKLKTLETLYDFNLQEQVSSITDTHETEMNEEIIRKENYKKTMWYWSGLSAFLILSIIAVTLFFLNKSKNNQKRFDILILKIKAFEEKIEEAKVIEESKDDIKSTTRLISVDNEVDSNTIFVIDDKKVEEILVKLEKLEVKLYFLRQDCTLHNMAKKLKTNTSYLSKIINTHLNKSFSIYINELRINYAILELKNNKRLRSYSVQGIAEEMGYKNADAFTRYFRAATGISPSVYIKKIKEINTDSNN